MADYKVTDTELTSIANAIRTKGGTQAQLEFPTGFVSAVQAIPTGGGGVIQPLSVMQNGTYNPPSGVDGYAPVTVSVPSGVSGNILTGTDEPTASVGSDGQIYLLYSSLPDGYLPVEYLEINGAGPYIDTEAYNTSEGYFEIVGNWTQMPGDNEGFFGALMPNIDTVINAWSGNKFISVGSSTINIPTPLVKHKYTANNNGIFIDDILVGTPNWNSVTNRSYYLFAINYSGGILKASHARIYGCKFYNGNSLIKSFVPAVRLSDSTAGMFDLIGTQFYENSGTGSFIAGAQVGSSNISFAYLKVNGQWQSLIGSDVNDVLGTTYTFVDDGNGNITITAVTGDSVELVATDDGNGNITIQEDV